MKIYFSTNFGEKTFHNENRSQSVSINEIFIIYVVLNLTHLYFTVFKDTLVTAKGSYIHQVANFKVTMTINQFR